MILSDTEILEEMGKGTIVIQPFDSKNMGSNSYDLHLGKTLAMYVDEVLDVKKEQKIGYFEIPEEGYVLMPGKLYLGVTVEYTETHCHVPCLENKSSLARLGLNIHLAPLGNVHFCNHWTLEISCLQPLRVYANMPIAQIMYFNINHEKIGVMYDKKQSAKYNEVCALPKESMMWKNFIQDN
jgi:dCTP deaminase